MGEDCRHVVARAEGDTILVYFPAAAIAWLGTWSDGAVVSVLRGLGDQPSIKFVDDQVWWYATLDGALTHAPSR